MQMISNIFYIVLYTTVIGTAFTILSLFLNHVFQMALTLWSGVLGMVLYVFPVLAPGLFLISPEVQVWVKGYRIACMIWVCGNILFVLYHLLKILFAYRAVDSYRICTSEHINTICSSCARMAGLKNVPIIYFGTLDDPACVMGVLHPVIILNEEVVMELTEAHLITVLVHEVTHIKRKHMVFSKIYNCVCFLNWFNPFVWIARKEFDVLCETDCDKKAIAILKDKISVKEYALTMLHLLEMSATRGNIRGNSLSAIGFLLTKQRIMQVMNRQSKLRSVISTIALIITVTAIICFSAIASRGYFYPYPAYNMGIEYSGIY